MDLRKMADSLDKYDQTVDNVLSFVEDEKELLQVHEMLLNDLNGKYNSLRLNLRRVDKN